MSKVTEPSAESSIPTVSEDNNSLGDIRINNSVVANIVRLAALEVSGVVAVGGSFVDGLPKSSQRKAVTSAVCVSMKMKSAITKLKFV